MDPLDDLPPDSRREVVGAVAAVLGVDTQLFPRVCAAVKPRTA